MTPRLRSDGGVALVVTLLVLVLIVAISFEIFRLGARAAETGAFERDSIRAAALAESGVGVAEVILLKDGGENDTLSEFWAQPIPPQDLGSGSGTVEIEDENRKINLNDLIGANGVGPRENGRELDMFRRLLQILELEPSIADAVIDWLDEDDTPGTRGAESDYYERLPDGYKAKNDAFDSLDELRLVRGVTPEAYAKLRPFVTVAPTSPENQRWRINLNTAPKEVLMALSGGKGAAPVGDIDESMADQIVERRAATPFREGDRNAIQDGMRNISSALGDIFKNSNIAELADVRSTTFHVRSTGDVNGIKRTVDAVGTRSNGDIQWRYWRLE